MRRDGCRDHGRWRARLDRGRTCGGDAGDTFLSAVAGGAVGGWSAFAGMAVAGALGLRGHHPKESAGSAFQKAVHPDPPSPDANVPGCRRVRS